MDEDLERLAGMAVSARHLVIAVVLAIAAAVLVGGAGIWAGLPPKPIAAVLLIAVALAFALAMKIRTPASAFPTIRILHDRPSDVAYIAVLQRGKRFLGVAARDGKLLAKPLVLKASALGGRVATVDLAVAEERARSGNAVAIVQVRCPEARVAEATDTLGLTSLQKLTTKAIRALG
jgi:hypothetical protein